MNMSDFKVIETQEELDRIIGEQLARQKEKFADYDQLRTRVTELETEKTGLESALAEAKKSSDTIAELQSKIAGYETSALRTRVALANGLPFDLAERLQGDDEVSLTADAERLASFLKSSTPQAPLKDNEPPLKDSKQQAMLNAVKNLTTGE